MLYFKQFLSGVDHASDNPNAASMANYCYAIGCTETKQCMLVDPTWAPLELVQIIEADGYTLCGVIGTHYHFDHIGGSAYGISVPGVKEILDKYSVPLFCHSIEKEWIIKAIDLSDYQFKIVENNSFIEIGSVSVKVLHTPGHSPGGICLLLDGKIIVGDTLFQEGCGRTDIPGGDTNTLLNSIATVISPLPRDLEVFCGHNYGVAPSMALGEIKKTNYIFNSI